MKNKKGVSVWVSAVLYFGIGILIIGIILAAGMPVVDRVRDKNIATQTKTVFYTFDKVIKDVAKEGGGSQRIMTADLKKGVLTFNQSADTMRWNYQTKAILTEPNTTVKEGPINITTLAMPAKGMYNLTYAMGYHCNLKINTTLESISGTRELLVYNTGSLYESTDPACGSPKNVTTIVIKEA